MRITLPGSPFFKTHFALRTAFKIDFCYIAVIKNLSFLVFVGYSALLVIIELTKLKNVRKAKPFTGS